MDAGRTLKMEFGDKAVALYHLIHKHEGFEDSAQALFKLVRQAEEKWPGKKRKLFLDIEGHRNSQGGFDADMVELQEKFLLGFLGHFLSEVHCPVSSVTNTEAQDDDVPPALIVRDEQKGNADRGQSS